MSDSVDQIVCVDWGICNQIYALGTKGVRTKICDYWPRFKEYDINRDPIKEQALLISTRPTLFILNAKPVFVDTEHTFYSIISQRGVSLEKIKNPDLDANSYQIYRAN
jgi:hypothetical protein